MIVGAGLAGLIAGHIFPRHRIVEKQPAPTSAHQAVLRFRSPTIGELTGIEFRPVTVRKGIWERGDWVPANITSANAYSRKVIGRVIDRSVWSLDPVTRWIAPAGFYWQLVDAMRDRIEWGTESNFTEDPQIINTSPLPLVLRILGIESELKFDRLPISVVRFQLPDYFDVYQTVYFPSLGHSLYRASITGNLLILEFAGEPLGEWKEEAFKAFNISFSEVTDMSAVDQEYGKIAPIEDLPRKALLSRLTDQHNIFSLGRFATWRNILLDDVAHDATVVKRLMALSSYERKLENT